MTKIRHIEKQEDDKIYKAFRNALYEQAEEGKSKGKEVVDKSLIHALINRMIEKEGYGNLKEVEMMIKDIWTIVVLLICAWICKEAYDIWKLAKSEADEEDL